MNSHKSVMNCKYAINLRNLVMNFHTSSSMRTRGDKINESLVFGVQEKGGGNVIYMIDNSLYRDF